MIKLVEIENVNGFCLRGLLDLPLNASEIVVMLHGFTGNRTEHNGHFRTLSRMLSKEGIASLRFDYHGNGESDGEFKDFVFENAVDDARRIIKYASSIEKIKKIDLLGFSMGGAIAEIVVDDNISKLILWSAAGTMKNTAHNCYEKSMHLPNGNAFFSGFEFSKKFVDSIDTFDLYENAKNYHKEVLIIQGTEDKAVNPECAKIYHQNFKNSYLHFIAGAGHGYDHVEEMQELYSETLKFIKKQ